MTEHTKEPWQIGAMESGRVAIDGDDESEVTGWIDPEDARRIVACVNACAGIPTEDLEAVTSFETAGVTTVRAVKKQRDELLAALIEARACIAVDRESLVECEKDPVTGQIDFAAQQVVAEYDAVLSKINAAIARAQGEAK